MIKRGSGHGSRRESSGSAGTRAIQSSLAFWVLRTSWWQIGFSAIWNRRLQKECLRNIARLVKPGGHLFVSGIDLDVRTRVARGMGWKPVTDLIRDIHEGDPSLRRGWPLEYWGLEPFCDDRSDWKIRYASVFQIGEAPLEISETLRPIRKLWTLS